MKKFVVLILMVSMLFSLSGCGSSAEEANGGGEKSQYAQALDVWNAIVASYGEGELFSVYGGDSENAVMDAPGKFDVSKTEELEYTLRLPQSQFDNIDDAASMVHMMNANTFTGAVYHLKDGTDLESFTDEVKTNVLATQWLCGFPDTLVIINVDGAYVITAFGEAGIMETFKANALSALSGAEVILETPIA
ncbi:MAG: hypothetical protein K2P65_05485 [Lachnospiraceae bacterium]|nr:hypothetical protein [Lachnospiraceae bacterium]